MASKTIDKLEAASRQLNTAISLWFNDGDAVGIHTLACSAHQIVHDINHRQGGRDLIYDSFVFKDEHRREINKKFKQHYNFFKHAEKDPCGTIEFDPSITEFFIIFTLMGLEILGREPDEVRRAFFIYYLLRNPDLLTEKAKVKLDTMGRDGLQYALNMPKQQFFEFYTLLRKQDLSGAEPFT